MDKHKWESKEKSGKQLTGNAELQLGIGVGMVLYVNERLQIGIVRYFMATAITKG